MFQVYAKIMTAEQQHNMTQHRNMTIILVRSMVCSVYVQVHGIKHTDLDTDRTQPKHINKT